MAFLHSAYTENTPEMREWLGKVGYELSKYYSNKLDLIFTTSTGKYGTFRNTPEEIERYSSTKHVIGGRLDCLGNPDLFKAVTAMRDDSDYMQWFILDEYRQCGIGGNIVGLEPRKKIGEKWFLYESNDLKITKAINQDIEQSFFGKSDMRKATLPEILERFKK